MVIIGIIDGVVDICVSIDDIQTMYQMYPDHLLMEQVGEETIGWTYDGVKFTAPIGD
jgi:hypothetical protein